MMLLRQSLVLFELAPLQLLVLIPFLCLNSKCLCTAFSFHPPASSGHLNLQRTKSRSPSSMLFMGKKKLSKSILSEMDLDLLEEQKKTRLNPKLKTEQKRPQRTSTSTSKISSKQQQQQGASMTISPSLAQWAKQTTAAAATQADDNSPTSTASSSATTFTTFDPEDTKEVSDIAATVASSSSSSPKSSRRQKQSARKAAEVMWDAQVQEILQEIESLVSSAGETSGNKKVDVDALLSSIRSLMLLTPLDSSASTTANNLRQLTAGASNAKSNDYRLAWVGSDDAICHVGTGLHKVPLARLQEVFLSCGPRNRVQMLEVIRILGPFPNIKNTLQGNSNIERTNNSNSENNMVTWKISWDSMVDGTGKEILAGKQENVRAVNLHVLFSDPSVLLAAVPPPPSSDPNKEKKDDALRDKGRDMLVFVREDALDDKLEALRVA